MAGLIDIVPSEDVKLLPIDHPPIIPLLASIPVDVNSKPWPTNPPALRTTELPKDILELLFDNCKPLLFKVYPVPDIPPVNVPVALDILPAKEPLVAVITPVMFALLATNPVEVKAKPVPDNPLLLRTTLLPKDIEELALVRDNPLLFRVYPVPETPPPNVPVAADILPEKVPPPFTVNVVPSQVNLSFSENVPFDPK